MWFDIRTSLESKGVSSSCHSKLAVAASFHLDCSCFSHVLRIKALGSTETDHLVDLVSAFGECETKVYNSPSSCGVELQAKFFDCRDSYKASTLMAKFSECKEFDIYPMYDTISGIEISLPSSLSKEELWYEISKHGDIAWSNHETLSSNTIVTYAFFDMRMARKFLDHPLILNGQTLLTKARELTHEQVCRFRSKGGDMVRDSLSSPSLSSISLSSASSLDRSELIYSPPVVAIESRKPSHLNILASPPAQLQTEHRRDSSDEEYGLKEKPKQYQQRCIPSRAMNVPGQLTPPLQECPVFESKSSSPETSTTQPISASGSGTSPKSNKVDLDLIKNGRETRTTVMLRNIPNKVNLDALRGFLDETNRHTYNFLYLRMDFNNKCNVGYAFINFTSPDHIATLTKARRGKKWSQYNSVKIIDVSFANIQGRRALIDKFRDSPIMSMDPEYRPKLYHTSGPLTGQEERFV